MRDLTLIGKIPIAKSIGISNIIYHMRNSYVPESQLLEIQNKVNKFIWNYSPPRVAHKTLIMSLDEGGLNEPDVVSIYKANKLTWLVKMIVGGGLDDYNK